MRRRRLRKATGNGLALVCDTAGIAYIASTQAYGEWTFDFSKSAASSFQLAFVDDNYGSAIDANGYRFYSSGTEFLQLVHNGVAVKWGTAASYIVADTWYSVKIVRASGTGVFTSYIQGGSFGTSWVLIDVSGGSGTNPVTENTVTTSVYFVFDLDAGDKVRRINAGTHFDVRDFTISTGAYHTSF